MELALSARLPGKRAFITGGGSGLGLALATRLARDGWRLGLLDRDPSRLAEAVTALSAAGAAAVEVYAADVSDEPAFRAAVAAFAARAGGLELFVNNAGIAAVGALEGSSADDWRAALEINVVGVAIGCRAALPILRRANAGAVLNVASAAAFTSPALGGIYNASKAAVVAISETLAQELSGTGIGVTVAMPGFFPTRLLESARGPDAAIAGARALMRGSRYTAERAAEALLAACARGELYVVVPSLYRRLWLFKRLLPQRAMRLIGARVARARSG